MELNERVQRLVFEAARRLNEQLPDEMRLQIAATAPIVGERSHLESLSLVTLLVDVEETLARELNWTVNLLDDGLAGAAGPGFETLGEMVDWILRERAGKSR